jgi:hypothetical protein
MPRGIPTDSATENRLPVSATKQEKVKRCGKSAPLEAQATRHGKPHRVQGQIGDPGAARSMFRESETGSGYWLLRQMILSCGEIRGRQNSAYSPSKTNFFNTGGNVSQLQFFIKSSTSQLLTLERRHQTSRSVLECGVFSAAFRCHERTYGDSSNSVHAVTMETENRLRKFHKNSRSL